MIAGTQITRELLEKTYGNLDLKQIYYIMKKLSTLNGVKTVKDRTKIRLYHQNGE